jgi:hypothetical protein
MLFHDAKKIITHLYGGHPIIIIIKSTNPFFLSKALYLREKAVVPPSSLHLSSQPNYHHCVPRQRSAYSGPSFYPLYLKRIVITMKKWHNQVSFSKYGRRGKLSNIHKDVIQKRQLRKGIVAVRVIVIKYDSVRYMLYATIPVLISFLSDILIARCINSSYSSIMAGLSLYRCCNCSFQNVIYK